MPAAVATAAFYQPDRPHLARSMSSRVAQNRRASPRPWPAHATRTQVVTGLVDQRDGLFAEEIPTSAMGSLGSNTATRRLARSGMRRR